MTRLRTRTNVVIAVVVIVIASTGVAIYATSSSRTSVSSRVTRISTISYTTSNTTITSIKSTQTVTSTRTGSSLSLTTSSSSATFVSLTSESVNNTCIIHSYNSSINSINAIYYECSATLNGDQSFKEFILRPTQLNGTFDLSVNGSQSIQVQVVDVNGTTLFSDNGTSVTYNGNAAPGELFGVVVTNSESSLTVYQLGLDWTSV
jgi:hypothetical protein